MLDGYFEFFMKPTVADMYMTLKEELNDLILTKVSKTVRVHNMFSLQLMVYRTFDLCVLVIVFAN